MQCTRWLVQRLRASQNQATAAEGVTRADQVAAAAARLPVMKNLLFVIHLENLCLMAVEK